MACAARGPLLLHSFATGPWARGLAPADQRRDGEQHDRHEEHDLGSFHRHSGDAAKAEHRSDQSDDNEKRNGPT